MWDESSSLHCKKLTQKMYENSQIASSEMDKLAIWCLKMLLREIATMNENATTAGRVCLLGQIILVGLAAKFLMTLHF